MVIWKRRRRPAAAEPPQTVHDLLTRPGVTREQIDATLGDLCGGFKKISTGAITAEQIWVHERDGQVHVGTGDEALATYERDELAP